MVKTKMKPATDGLLCLHAHLKADWSCNEHNSLINALLRMIPPPYSCWFIIIV